MSTQITAGEIKVISEQYGRDMERQIEDREMSEWG